MDEFHLNMSTRIFFGNGQLRFLGKDSAKYGSRVLLMYDNIKIKRNMIYADILRELEKYSIEYSEFSCAGDSGSTETVEKGIRALREQESGMILAIGTGQLVSTAKAVSAGIYSSQGFLNMLKGDETVTKAVPTGVVLTGAPYGSEAGVEALIFDREGMRAGTISSDFLRPRFMIMDPAYAGDLKRDEAAPVLAEVFSRILSSYFGTDPFAVTESHLLEGLLRALKGVSGRIKADPSDMDALGEFARISLYGGAGIFSQGPGESAPLQMARELSLKYHREPGWFLPALIPAWLSYISGEENMWRFRRLGQTLWNLSEPETPARVTERLREYLKAMGPVTLTECGCGDMSHEELAENLIRTHGPAGKNFRLDHNDIVNIYRMAL